MQRLARLEPISVFHPLKLLDDNSDNEVYHFFHYSSFFFDSSGLYHFPLTIWKREI